MLTRQNELVTVLAQKQHQETRTTIADESQMAKKTLLHTLTDRASVQDQPLSINVQTICVQIDSARESLISQMNIVGKRARREMKQQFMELRHKVEKACEAYHKQSEEFKETVARMSTLTAGPTRQTLQAKANSTTDLLSLFLGIYKTLTL